MNEDRLDELLDIALETGELPANATAEERAELAPLLRAATVIDASAETVAAEAIASMPLARARFERFIASETAPAPVDLGSQRAHSGMLGRLFGPMRPVAAMGVAVAVVLLVVVGVLGSDLILSDTSSAYALDADPGDYLQVNGVVTELTEGEDGPRIRLESEGGFIEVDVSGDTSVLRDNEALDVSNVRVGQRLAVTGLVNPQHRVRAAILSVQGNAGEVPAKVPVDRPRNIDEPLVGSVSSIRFGKDHMRGNVTLKLANGRVVAFHLGGEQVANFFGSQGFGPGVQVQVSQAGDEFAIAPVEQRDDPCLIPQSVSDRHGLETLCGILLSRDDTRWTLQTLDGVQTVILHPDAQIIVPASSGLTRNEVLETDAANGHGVQISGHKRGDQFVVGLLIVGPEGHPPPRPTDRR